MNLKFMKSKEVKEVLNLIYEQWGFNFESDYVFLMNEKGDVFVINRDIERIEFENLNINSLGLYFGELRHGEFRLSVDGSQIIGPNSSKNVFDISDDELKGYMNGEDIHVDKEDTGFLLVRNKDNFFGCSKVREGKMLNFFPKSRRIVQS